MTIFESIIDALPILSMGALVTIKFTILSLFFGFITAIMITLMTMSPNFILSRIACLYVSLMRGTPLLVQIFVVYYGLPAVGITFNPTTAGVIALSANAAAYLSESIRGAINGVARDQWHAAASLGLTKIQTLLYIISPQALRLAIPSLGNTCISLVKDTSLVSVITVTELLRSTQELIAVTFLTLPFYLMAALYYWIMCLILESFQQRLEKRLSRSILHHS